MGFVEAFAPAPAVEEVRDRVAVLRAKADRAREEARSHRSSADEQDEYARRSDLTADQYEELLVLDSASRSKGRKS